MVLIACMSIRNAGDRNSALFAAEVLALKDEKVRGAVEEYKKKLKEG